MSELDEERAWLIAEPAVRRAAHWLCWLNPDLDRDEVLGEARLIALEAIRSFNAERNSDLEGWVAWAVRRRLSKLALANPAWRRRMLRQEVKTLTGAAERVAAPEPGFDLYRLMSRCTRDAREVLDYCLREQVRTAAQVFSFLRLTGWSASRILRAFSEIRESL